MSESDPEDDLPLSVVTLPSKRLRSEESVHTPASSKRPKHEQETLKSRSIVATSKGNSNARVETNGTPIVRNGSRSPASTTRNGYNGKNHTGISSRKQASEKKPRTPTSPATVATTNSRSTSAASTATVSRLKKARSREREKLDASDHRKHTRAPSVRSTAAKAEVLIHEDKPRPSNRKRLKAEPKLKNDEIDSIPAETEEDGDDMQCWWESGGNSNGGIKWKTLSHNAVMFPPEYIPHNIPILYDGQRVELIPRCEEIATFFAAKMDTEYVSKSTFRNNFFNDFRASLKRTPAYSIVKSIDKCDFSLIKAHLDRKKEEKKELSSAEKKALKEAEAENSKKYLSAIVDGREEKVGNFRVEPPGLFLGRGEHPRMGKVKARIYPEDITINIGEDSPVPEVPIPGHKWGNIVHDNKVTWLAGWKDSITGGRKYVFLSAGSQFKGMSDRDKFEKARALGRNIDSIRRDYRAGWNAKSKEVRQRSVAMYLIDKLALRVGNEKSEDEADTVGCCSLRVEHLKLIPPNTVEFDFLGKDSMRYHNQVAVEPKVFDNLGLFLRNKKPGDEVFHRLTVSGLNEYLKSLMPGLSAKVFRTYNASITLDRLLQSTPPGMSLNEKIVFYNQQNKEVAILCNHQRSAPKSHEAQMEKLQTRVQETEEFLQELQRAQRKLTAACKKGNTGDTATVVEYKPVKPEFTENMDDKARAAERKRAAEAPRVETSRSMTLNQVELNISRVKDKLNKLKADMTVKDDLKTVALGTSKINYLDPRITVAWCKAHDVPIEKLFASALLVKFAWAMPTPTTFSF